MKRKWKSILILALPYAITVLLPMISVLCLGSMIVSDYHEKIITDRQKSIESAFERFWQRINNIETLSHMIAQNNVLTTYAYASLRGEDHSLIDNMEIRDLLNGFCVNNDVSYIYFYDASWNRIITTNAVFSNAEDYFKYSYQLEGYTQKECVDRLKTLSWGINISPSVKVNQEHTVTEVIEYRVSVPLKLINNLQPQLVLVMKVEDIFGDFFDILDDDSEIYIYDSGDQLVYGRGNHYEEVMDISKSTDLKLIQNGDEEIYGMVCHTLDRSWKIKIYIPDLVADDNVDTLSPYVWLLMVVPLLVSTVLCIFFTFRNHREIQETLRLFKYETLDKLIRNTYVDRKEMITALTNESLNIQDGKCVVLCIRYKGSCYRTFVSEDMTIKDLVKGLLSELIETKYEIFDTSARETICVLSMDNENMEVIIRDIISRLNVEIAYYYNIEVEIGVGDVVESMYYISNSYMQARDVIRYRETSGKKVYLYSELARLEDVYYYPREYDEKIYNYVVVGKKEEAKEIIRKIYKENFVDNTGMLSVSAIETIKSRLRDSLIALVEKYDISIEGLMQELNSEQNVKKFFDVVCQAVDIIAEKIVNKKKIVQQHSAWKIMEYVENNYCDNMLSVKQISKTLGLHENYISNLFRNEYGENLSVVIERKRIEKACELLKKSEMKISEIAEAVGYSTDASFRRAFKKITSVSPVEYRGE